MKWIIRLVVGLGAVAIVLLGLGYTLLRASLPQLEGRQTLSGLAMPLRIDRDEWGVPTIDGRTRSDVAAALGFLHAQERFFQMDLLRRKAAGELAALFGSRAVDYDQKVRRHRLRAVAQAVVASMDERGSALLEHYVSGVNQGLATLSARPFEYVLLRHAPQPWRMEDSVLVVLAMFLELQDHAAERDRFMASLSLCLPDDAARFLVPPGTTWDAALDGTSFTPPAIPAAALFNPRALFAQTAVVSSAPLELDATGPMIGSNNWGVPGAMTEHGGALLAGDMHLKLGVPNIWYRARMMWGEGDSRHDLIGVTLPGVPSLVAGSNGHVAWTFTNGYLDTADAVLLDESADGRAYRVGDEWQDYVLHEEIIEVSAAESVALQVKSTPLGPRVDNDVAGRPWMVAWAGHFASAVDPLALLAFESARSVDEVVGLAAVRGIPVQNLIVADVGGDLAWTVVGKMPTGNARVGALSFDEALERWRGWRDGQTYPRLRADNNRPLWTANNRVVGDDAYAQLGDGGFALGARAHQIRRRLDSRQQFDETAMLQLQLDDEALFLQRWRQLLLTVLEAAGPPDDGVREEMARLVSQWSGRADPQDVGYRLVRAFRLFLAEEVFNFLLRPCHAMDGDFSYQRHTQWEGPLWELITVQPQHFLNPQYDSWSQQFAAAVTRVATYFADKRMALSEATWGDFNRLRMTHPLSAALPGLGALLNMPSTALPGDENMPRVQGPGFGASQRMVVAPGHEDRGLFQMPGGQSGHPLSPFFSKGHLDWEIGRSAPLLPQISRFTLYLDPAVP